MKKIEIFEEDFNTEENLEKLKEKKLIIKLINLNKKLGGYNKHGC